MTDVAALVAKAKAASEDPQVQDNHLFHLLFNRHSGLWGDHAGMGGKRLRRRAWIEKYFRIRNEKGEIVPLVLNHAQRQLEATILRMERAGVPVRIQVLKARKEGISTYIGALSLERGLRDEYFRSLIIAHKKDSSKVLLGMIDIARQRMPKRAGVSWDFKMRSQAKMNLEWAGPSFAEIALTSAEVDNPARGFTPSLVHGSETASWPKAAEKASAVFSALPTFPGTYGFDESTAQGASGKFHDDFWSRWKERDIPLGQREQAWSALFFPWWGHDNYRYSKSYGAGRPVDDARRKEIINARDTEEDWLLRQKYLRRWRPDDEWEKVIVNESEEIKIKDGKIVGYWRCQTLGRVKWRRKGVGWQRVDVDQLVWRRMKIRDTEFSGDVDLFNREFPSRPEVAFSSTGSPIFDTDELSRRLEAVRAGPKPPFRGTLVAAGFSTTSDVQPTRFDAPSGDDRTTAE